MSISNFLKEKVEIKEENIKDLNKFRKPVKVIKVKNKACSSCGKNRFIVAYKKNSNKVLAYRCEYCGHPIFVKEKVKKVVKKEENEQLVEDIGFKCPVGGVRYCLLEACFYYNDNTCELTKK